MFSSKNISSVNMVWNGSRDICSRDALSRLIGRLLWSPAAVGGGGGGGEIVCEENEEEILWGNAEVALGQLCNLMFQLLEWPSSCHHDGSRRRRRMRRITPVGLASLLFGIASTLVFIGSTAFMIGIMMMPLIAMLATTLCFVAFLTNLAAPGMTFWPWCRPQQHDRHDYALHQPS